MSPEPDSIETSRGELPACQAGAARKFEAVA